MVPTAHGFNGNPRGAGQSAKSAYELAIERLEQALEESDVSHVELSVNNGWEQGGVSLPRPAAETLATLTNGTTALIILRDEPAFARLREYGVVEPSGTYSVARGPNWASASIEGGRVGYGLRSRAVTFYEEMR